jgi:ATP-dependent helicase/nuclease subunit A
MMDTSVLNSDPEFTAQTKGEFLAVQGVIDLIIEDTDGNVILCDYKTDRLSRAELSDSSLLLKTMTERHSKQLSYYTEAVRQLFGKACKNVCIYSTHAAKLIEIPTYEMQYAK